ncbi:MAG: hypothetical protein SF339_21935 [Blastocatellia bacterium]|nr:hypothetical protein [Blastocatellia bacterium]
MKSITLILCLCLLLVGCASTGQIGGNTPQGARGRSYPPMVEGTAERELAVREAWRQFCKEFRLPEAKPDLEAVLYTPRSLPLELAGRIYLNARSVAFDEMEAASVLRGFIERARGVLTGEGAAATLGIKDLSLATFTKDGNFYRATYRQVNYPYPIVEGYGELRIVIGKDGTLLQLGSRLIPAFELPAKPEIQPQAVAAGLVGREFKYASVAGQPMSYKIADRAEIAVGDPVVYPKIDGKRLTIHLAFPIQAGKGITWTVFIDAITGTELGVKQNFAS